MKELLELLKDFDIPEMRKTDLQWLNRNLGIRNSQNPKFEEVRLLIKTLLNK